uniref:Type II secretion system protein GspE N-terminal domain-containing protein n=1 Tax=Fundidesulfovibrio putealis TaxID=270496 RepID=A0A7C4EL19_9BACT
MNGTGFFGDFLLRQGAVTPDQLRQALASQARSNRRMGDLCVEAGVMTPGQVEDVLDAQRGTDACFGQLAIARGYLRRKDLDALLFRQHVNQVHLGEALLTLGALTERRFCELLDLFHAQESRRRRSVDAALDATTRPEAARALATGLERGFARQAGLCVKPLGPLDPASAAAMPHVFPATAVMPGFGRLDFALRMGDDLPRLLGARLRVAGAAADSAPGTEPDAVRTLLDGVCGQLGRPIGSGRPPRPTGPAHPAASGETGLLLACPGALFGLVLLPLTA